MASAFSDLLGLIREEGTYDNKTPQSFIGTIKSLSPIEIDIGVMDLYSDDLMKNKDIELNINDKVLLFNHGGTFIILIKVVDI